MTRSPVARSGFSRRGGLVAGAAALASLAFRPAMAQQPSHIAGMDPALPDFSPAALRRLAQALAQQAPRPRATPVAAAQALTYDDQRQLRFRADHALWADQASMFRAELFPAVYLAARPVALYEVVTGRANPISFSPAMFDAPEALAPALAEVVGFSGFRLQWPLNRADKFDEIGAFQGASYFRSLGRNQHYGLSARGLSLRTGEDEEFPHFTAWWIERPAPNADRVVLHALMESDSLTGAYRIQVIPGAAPIYEIDAEIYPRRTIDAAGVAPMSSMFLFGSIDPSDRDDFRSAVHDSDGLLIRTRDGAATWRPLSNPRRLQMSRFETDQLAGFGLVQRTRGFDDYGDLEARYDRRPTLWIEPLEDWGAGAVQLLEIPTRLESDDNIACFWRPDRPWPAGAPVRLRYRLTWCESPPPGHLATVIRTRSGAEGGAGMRLFSIDFTDVGDIEGVEREVTSSSGEIVWSAIQPHASPGAARVAFGFRPAGGADLSVRLMRAGAPLSETWRYRWPA